MQWLLESWNGRRRGCSWCPPISLQQSWFLCPLLWPDHDLLLVQCLFRPETLSPWCPLEATSAHDIWESVNNYPTPSPSPRWGNSRDVLFLSLPCLSPPTLLLGLAPNKPLVLESLFRVFFLWDSNQNRRMQNVPVEEHCYGGCYRGECYWL